MSKVVTAYGNFVKGQIDHDINGRYELPTYNTGMDIFTNFISNYKGNAIFSAGFVSQVAFQDCAFLEFKFGITQDYLIVGIDHNFRFLAFDTDGNFGWVLDGGSPINLPTPYSLDEIKFIATRQSYTQNSDVMYIAHRNYEPRRLIRTASNAFTIGGPSWVYNPFTAPNWPGAVCFYKGRLWYASTPDKLTTTWMSRIASYDDFNPTDDPVLDSSPFSFTCTDITQQIEWIFPGDNSLIFGATDGIIAVNGGTVNTAITAATVQANITSAEPTNGYYPLKKDGLIFYVGRASRNMYSFKYDILTEAFLSSDANLVAYDITRGNLTKIRYRHDRNNLIYSLRGDNHLVSLVFQEKENINGWHDRSTKGAFTDIGVIGDNLGDPQLFVLANRGGTYYIERQADYVEFKKRADFWTPSTDNTDQGQNEDIDREAYIRYVSEQLRKCNYLDNSIYFDDYRSSTITFTPTGTDPITGTLSGTLVSSASDFTLGDATAGKHIVYKTATGYESGRFVITAYTSGTTVSVTVLQDPKIDSAGPVSKPLYTWSSWYKSFKTVSGFSQYSGNEIGLVTDGGFLDAVTNSGDTITLPNQTTSLCVGYQYTGIIKTMCLGFVSQGKNTQVTYKTADRFSVRTVSSMGIRAGTSLYDLTDVQLRTPNDINYLPPEPLDGTYTVEVTDDSDEDKFVFIVQDQPLPATLTNFAVEADYASSS